MESIETAPQDPVAARLEPPAPQPGELLYGYQAIADHLGLTVRETRHQAEANGLPIFRLGRGIVARVRSLHAWIDLQESKPRPQKELKRSGRKCLSDEQGGDADDRKSTRPG